MNSGNDARSQDGDHCTSTTDIVRVNLAPGFLPVNEDSSASEGIDKATNSQHKKGNPMEGPFCQEAARPTDAQTSNNGACRFYLRGVSKGKCRAGVNCRNAHWTADKRCIRCYAELIPERMEEHSGGCPKNLLPSGLIVRSCHHE